MLKFPADAQTACMPGLRVLRSAAAALPARVLLEARRRLSPNIYVSYGVNELGTLCGAGPELLERYPDTVGRALSGVQLQVADDAGQPAGEGVTGEVRVRGDGMVLPMARGASLAEAAREVRGWHYPRDTARLSAEGALFLTGRSDDVMNVDGVLVGPTEIEAVLQEHPAVAEVAAFALPSSAHQEVPAVAVVLKRESSRQALLNYCADRLGMRAPRFVFAVDTLPRNAMGKVLRRRLSETFTARARARRRRRRSA
jgi:acyl-coenzyme A synthetase/AMP-(fatty) acid ligase